MSTNTSAIRHLATLSISNNSIRLWAQATHSKFSNQRRYLPQARKNRRRWHKNL